jgi:phage-related protein
MTPIVWVGGSKDALKAFPDDARQDAGFQLSKVQHGEEPDDWKPMSTIGSSVREIRIRERSGAFRIIYVVRYRDAIYVLHAFQKKVQKTRSSDLLLARERFQSIPR